MGTQYGGWLWLKPKNGTLGKLHYMKASNDTQCGLQRTYENDDRWLHVVETVNSPVSFVCQRCFSPKTKGK